MEKDKDLGAVTRGEFETTIVVRIKNLKVDREGGYSFYWTAIVNGKKRKEEFYSSSHSWGKEYKKFRRILRKNWAAQIIIQSLTI